MSDSPIWFGSTADRLFGWVHLPAAPHRGTGVVLCPPIGYEHLCSYPTFRRLAEALAADGFHVLRFDYACTGDSAGAWERARIPAWLTSVRDAAAELRRMPGVERIAMVGLRMGATLAAAAAAESAVDGLVLWAPFASGRALRRELIALGGGAGDGGAGDGDDAAAPRPVEAAGFAYSADLLAGIGTLDLTAPGPRPASAVLCIWRDGLRPDAKLAAALAATGATVDQEQPDGTAHLIGGLWWEVEPPEPIVELICGWLRARYPDRVSRRAPERVAAGQPRAVVEPGVAETAVRFGPERLFGIVSEPALVKPRDTAIAILTTGVDHRIGTSRMSVGFARRWAALGYRVLRLDVAGIGDSPARPGAARAVPYSPTEIEDARAAVALLQQRGAARVVVVGLCSGGFTAVNCVLRGLPIAGACAVNPQLYWRPGDSLALHRETTDVLLTGQRVQRSARSPRKWARLLTGRVDVQDVFRAVVRHRQARHHARDAARRARSALGDMAALSTAPVPSLVVFAERDPGLRYLGAFAPGGLERLPRESALTLTRLPGADHSFTARRARESLSDVVTEYLAATHP